MTYLWFFLALAAVMAVQIYFTGRQAKAFMAAVRTLRARGTVTIGLGGRKWIGRKAYIAIAAKDGRVVDAVVLRGVTQFARPKPQPRLVGVSVRTLAGDRSLPGVDAIERDAARQAARTMNASGGWQPTGGVEGEEGTHPVTGLVSR